ncbi:MAG: HAD family hydrolase [Candidatus Kerfeldbacteria bacterium]|nr:HAD family hydrolase [Candidatus Kerfeldbacteria bacterium]
MISTTPSGNSPFASGASGTNRWFSLRAVLFDWSGTLSPVIAQAPNELNEACRRLRQAGCRLGVVSNISTDSLEAVLTEGGLRDHFDVVSGEAYDKPQALRQAVIELGLDPAAAMYVGDLASDIEAGRRAGLQAGAVLTGFDRRQELERAKPDLLIPSILDLPAALGLKS